jgi:hypothetical protein
MSLESKTSILKNNKRSNIKPFVKSNLYNIPKKTNSPFKSFLEDYKKSIIKEEAFYTTYMTLIKDI